MSAANRALIAGLAVAGLLGAFWLVVLAPKREEASDLQQRIEQLEASVAEQEQIAAAAERAREDFDVNYQRLVVLGKAVPEDEDTASLFVQLDEIARDAKVEFEAIRLDAGGGADPAAATGPEQTTVDGADAGDEDADGDDGGEGSDAEGVPAAVVPTEPAVAGLPLGATVGPAGLPVMPYAINLRGTFFQLADFFDGLDRLVRPADGQPRVRGRLLTVDGFGLSADDAKGFPLLSASLAVTTFVIPATEGLTAGASSIAPPPALPASDPTPAPQP